MTAEATRKAIRQADTRRWTTAPLNLWTTPDEAARNGFDLAEVEIFPCRELMPTDDVRQRASELYSSEPWGREQWQRLADGAEL